MPLTVTGVAGTSINAACTAPDPLDSPTLKPLSSTAHKATLQSIENDIATIAAGNVTIAGNKTFTGGTTMGDVTISQGNALIAAGTGCGLAGTWTASGNVHFAQTREIVGDGTGASMTGKWHYPGGVTGFALADAPSYLTDADATLDTANAAQCFIMTTNPAADRTLTLRQSTAPVPPEGLWFELTAFIGTSNKVIKLKREGSGNFVAVIGDGAGAAGMVGSARVQVVSGVWRLVRVGGTVFSATDS